MICLLCFMLITFNTTDVVTTHININQGAREVNPLMPRDPWRTSSLKIVTTTVQVLIVNKLNKSHPRIAKVTGIIMLSLPLIATIHNIRGMR